MSGGLRQGLCPCSLFLTKGNTCTVLARRGYSGAAVQVFAIVSWVLPGGEKTVLRSPAYDPAKRRRQDSRTRHFHGVANLALGSPCRTHPHQDSR